MQKNSEIGGTKSRPQPHRATPSAPASSYQSPLALPVQQQATPISQISPPAYGYSPFGTYAYGSPYYAYAPSGPFVADGYGHYYAYSSPSHYPYPGYTTSPSYDSQSQGTSEVASSPDTQSSAYSQYYSLPYAGGQNAPQWHLTTQPATQQQVSPPATYYPPVYPQPVASDTDTGDRSGTPTPTGYTVAEESQLESQQ